MKPACRDYIIAVLALSLFLLPVLISPGTTYLYSVKTPFLHFSGFLLLALWLVCLSREKTHVALNTSTDLPVLLFLVWTGLSVFRAYNKFLAVEGVLYLTSLVCVYFVVSRVKPSLKLISKAAAFSGFIVSVYGIVQFYGYDFIAGPPSRAASTFGNLNFAGEYIAPAIILTAALLLSAPARRGKLLFGAILILQCVYLLITKARGAWVGLAAGALIYVILLNGHQKIPGRIAIYLLSVFASLVLIITLAAGKGPVDSVVSQVYSIGNLRHPTVQIRFHMWNSVLEIIRDYPVLGTGAGNLQIAAPVYRSRDEILEEYKVSGKIRHVNRAHNDFLETASDSGVPGLALFLWILISAVITVKRGRESFTVFEAGFSAMLACILASALFGFPLRNPSTGLLFWAGLGIIASRGRTRRAKLPEDLSIIKKSSFLLLFLVLAYSSLWLMSDFYLERGRRRAEDADWLRAQDYFEKSIKYYYPGIRAHAALAYSHFIQGDLENAYASLMNTLELNPNHHRANYLLGRVYFELRQDEKAVYHVKKSAGFNPLYYSHLGKLYVLMEDYEKAEHYIMKQLRLGFPDAECYIHLGELFEAKGEPERAARAYRRALMKRPELEFLRDRIKGLEAPGKCAEYAE